MRSACNSFLLAMRLSERIKKPLSWTYLALKKKHNYSALYAFSLPVCCQKLKKLAVAFYKPYPMWKFPVKSRTKHKTTTTAGSPHPTMQYLIKVFLMSEGCLLVLRTVKKNISNLSIIIESSLHWFRFCITIINDLFKNSRQFLAQTNHK